MYLGADAPWLKTDEHWTALYTGPAKADAKADISGRVYMAMRRVGNGELIAASQEAFLLNEAIKKRPNPVVLDFLTGGRPVIWVDETLHGLHQNQGQGTTSMLQMQQEGTHQQRVHHLPQQETPTGPNIRTKEGTNLGNPQPKLGLPTHPSGMDRTFSTQRTPQGVGLHPIPGKLLQQERLRTPTNVQL